MLYGRPLHQGNLWPYKTVLSLGMKIVRAIHLFVWLQCSLLPLVPLYDGRSSFKLAEYTELPQLHSEVAEDSAVLVTFSLGSYRTNSDSDLARHKIDTCLSLNVQSVVLLAEGVPLPPGASPETSAYNHLGVESDTEDLIGDEGLMGDEEDDFSS